MCLWSCGHPNGKVLYILGRAHKNFRCHFDRMDPVDGSDFGLKIFESWFQHKRSGRSYGLNTLHLKKNLINLPSAKNRADFGHCPQIGILYTLSP